MAGKRAGLAARRQAVGLSQEALAEHLSVERTTIQRWEAGTSTPQPWHRPRLARVLRISVEHLAQLIAPGPASPPITRTATDVSRHAASPTVLVLSALTGDARARTAQALREPRRFLDHNVIAVLGQQLDALMHNDGARGPIHTIPGVLGLLAVIERSASDVLPAVRRDLLSLAARGAEFAGWLYRDSHRDDQAMLWYHRATDWAQEAGDLPMQGYLLLKKSQMAYDQRDALRVRALAEAAKCGPWDLPPRVRAEVTQQAALGLAMTGEPVGVVERTLDDARMLLDRAEAESTSPDPLGQYFTNDTLGLRNASCFTEAGNPSRAATLFATVLVNGQLSRRDRGYFQARRAAALALSGEPDEAAQLGVLSAEVARATSSERTLRVLGDVLRTLDPWRSRPSSQTLRDALAD